MNVFKKMMLRILNKKGYVVRRKLLDDRERQLHNDALACAEGEAAGGMISIVFSRDRAMQLQAFLRSYLEKVVHPGLIYVLYKASDDRHHRSYEELQSLFATSGLIVWMEETNFNKQLIDLLHAGGPASRVALYVDDMLFLHPVDYADLSQFPTQAFIPSLCRGKDMTYSAVMERPIDLPDFTATSFPDLFSFPWNQYAYLSDWTYPMGISGYIYGRFELLSICRCIDFKNPNSLESAMQLFKDIFAEHRLGICYEKAACCCVHANIVQTECQNPTFNYFSVEDLLEKWEQGFVIDVSAFYGESRNEACCQKYTFEKR